MKVENLLNCKQTTVFDKICGKNTKKTAKKMIFIC